MQPLRHIAVALATALLGLTTALLGLTTPALGANRQGPQRYLPGEVLIKFRPQTAAADRANIHADLHAQVQRNYGFIGVEHLKLNGVDVPTAIARYQHNPHVEYIEPNYEVRGLLVPNDPRFPEMYGLRNTGQTGGTAGADIKAVQAWDLFVGDPNILVGVIDTGVDYNHPDLAANIWTNPGEIPGNGIDDDHNGYVDDVHGYDFSNNDGDPFDDNGHGTHTSGTIAAVGDNNVGVTGVNWHAKIVAIKFLNSGGSGSTAGAIASVQYAIAVGVRLTSNSWGGGGFSQALLDAINAAGAAGQLFVAAAGNSSQNTDVTPNYPSTYDTPYIIAVAATDHNDNLASFSNYGATTVDLAAPGVNILSTLPGNSYGTLSGTSMATPHAAGVVALAMGRFPAVPNLQIKNLVLSAVDVKASLQGKCLTNGRLNAFMTIAEPDSIPPGNITNLTASDPGSNTMRLDWTATGDDGNTGRAVRYEIRYSTAPITAANFGSATLVPGGPDPHPAGSAESFTVTGLGFSTPYYFAIKAFDEFANAGPISNVATGTTLGAPDITATPAAFSSTLLSGATETQTLQLANDGAGTLDFTIAQPELVFAQPVRYEPLGLAKGEADPRVGDPVTFGSGGPDGAGYRWMDSDSPGGPAFAWEDITATGTPVAVTGDDATSAPIDIGMTFPFYGTNHTNLRVCTNGFLSFTDTSNAYGNQPLPNTGAPANLVAPFWNDLDFGGAQRAYTYGDGTRFIVSWVGVPHYGGGGPYTFQAILYTTGEIRFQYLSMGAPANQATLGIQNATKDVGLTVAFNTTYVHDNLAVRILSLPQWLTVSPTSGRVLPGAPAAVQVRFNALGLLGGDYDGTLRVASNDPDEATVALPAHLHVTGAPQIGLNPTALDFGQVFVGAHPTRTFIVSNPGTDNLVVSNIASSDPTLAPDITAFTLAPSGARNVIVTWSPTAPMTLAATLTVSSNDPDEPTRMVSVAGSAVPAPSFSVDPTAFDVSLLTNTATSRNLRVRNTGGSNYVFTAEALTFSASGSVTVHGDADNIDIGKGMADQQFGPTPLRAGGPDVFGYTYQDSDEPGGPAFGWIDIRPVGTQIAMTGDDTNRGTFPIGFDFPFYGKTFNSFRICTNGWVTFSGSTLTTFTNTSLPNTGSTVPPNMLAVFWDDMDFQTVNRAYYYNDGTKLVIQYQDVPRHVDLTHPNTFEIILFPNGTIVYQYLSMQATDKTSATVGMQNETRNDGLQVVFNNTYVKNNLAIRFRPPARFLTVNPTSGTVPPGGFLDLAVGFNAGGLFGGTYNGAVRIRGNDPVLPQLDVPAVLHVTGVPDIAASPANLDFGNVFIGFPKIVQLSLSNIGTDNLVVTTVASTNPAYGADQTSFTVPPLGNALLLVSFNAPGTGTHSGQLVISSNDPDTPSLAVNLTGVGVVPPDIAADPAALSSTLDIPNSETQTLTLHNAGGSNLNFVIGAQITASSVPVYDELPLGKGETDPRPGILGSGGPDVFGYTWRDSDEPGGPAFDWVDITGIGTPITLPSGDDANVPGVLLGFDFPFYGNTFNTVNVCSNGWLSFTSTLTSLTNNPLPSSGSGVPENLLAVFWDDLVPGTAPPRLYAYRDGTRFIVSYVGVPHYTPTGTGLYTFQVILYPSGRIVYQYLDMQGLLNSCTIGIQNAARNDGLTVAFNANYVHNNLAIELRTLPDWLTATPTTGTIPAGGSTPIQVLFNSQDLFGGLYSGSIRIASNDPDEGVLQVPATLQARGVPDIATTPAALDFGTLYVSQTRDINLKISNMGSDVLTVQSAGIDNPAYSLVGASFPLTLGNHGAANLTVRFAPASACSPCTGTMSFVSNDPDENPLHVALTGIALIPPEIETSPTALRAALATTLGPTALTRTKQVVLRNTGGSDLNWRAQALTMLPAVVNGPATEGPKDDKGEPGAPVTQARGGPDAAGYRWVDSDDPADGVPFFWEDIAAVGTPIPFTGDDQNLGPFPLPFPFPFYGNVFNSFRACTNGWISFTNSARTTFTNEPLPNAGSTVPENLIAPFWDDLTFSSSGSAYYHYDGTKVIISYVNVPHFLSGGPYTFQILLYPSGMIDFQYLDMQGTRLNEATVGIQNATRDVGLQMVFNAAYVKNNLRVRITNRPWWLRVSPATGVLPAGQQTTVQVTFDATELTDGDYSGLVRFASNDLTNPIYDLPCDLHVGVITAAWDIDPNTLSRQAQGNWAAGIVELPAGHDARHIRVSSLLVEDVVPVAPNSPTSYTDTDADGLYEGNYKFDRAALLAVLPVGNAVNVDVIGEEEDVTWFAGTDVIRVLRPRTGPVRAKTANGEPIAYGTGSSVHLEWSDPEGYPAQTYDLWYSANAGESWTLVSGGLTVHQFEWKVPAEETDAARLELVAIDAAGVMGSWLSEPFVVGKGGPVAETRVPLQFALQIRGNPGPQADIQLALPHAEQVDLRVYDARGKLVRRVEQRPFAAGYYGLFWDGRNATGAPAPSGIYFVRLVAGKEVRTLRYTLLR